MVTVIDHPLIKVKLAIMRDEKTKSKEFRESLDEIASLMCYEVFKDLKTHEEKEEYIKKKERVYGHFWCAADAWRTLSVFVRYGNDG